MRPSSRTHDRHGRGAVLLPVALALEFLVGASMPAASAEIEATRSATADGYVTAVGGHLYRNDARLRQWGVNLQSGVYPTYAEIDNLVLRLKGLGFNAVRLWPTAGTFYANGPDGVRVNVSQREDGSALDRFDYLVWRLGEAGMTIQMTALHYLDLPMLRALRDEELAGLIASTSSDADLRRLHGFAPYVYEPYRRLLESHIEHVLTRVNAYSGRRYADEPAVSAWELANEANFVACATNAGCLRSLPPIARDALAKTWREFAQQQPADAIPGDTIVDAHLQSASYRRFVAERFIDVSRRLEETARRVGGTDSGVAVQPFIYSTGPIASDALAHYAYGAGDVFSVSAYHSPLVRSGGLDESPWLPVTAGGPPVPFLEYVKIEGKPLVVYETSFFRPYPFRAEWGPMMAALALRQDWDAVFLYMYGQPWVIYEGVGAPADYGLKPLPEPVYGAPGEYGKYTYGFHHGGDPVSMASWAVGAGLFVNTPPGTAQRERAAWDIPLDGVFGAQRGYPEGFVAPSNRLQLPRTTGVSVRFLEPGREAQCAPCLIAEPNAVDDVVIEWGSTESPFRVATPAATVIAGRLYGELGSLGQGLAASVSEAGFGVVARIGHPGDASHVYVIGDQQNSGMQFDASMTNFDSPAGALSGMLDRGNLPFVHAGPTVHLTTDGVRRQARVVSFDREPGSLQSFHGKTLRPGDGVFRLDIEPVQPESDATWGRRRTGRSLKHW